MTRRLLVPWSLRDLSLLLLSSALLLGGWLATSQAQVRTTITSDGTLGTTVNSQGNVYAITGGTRPSNGPNLFHSFDRFSVGTGDVASFTGSQTGIKNILSRVTGGQRSDIDGQLRLDGQLRAEGANLYLLNPAGVLFGPNASLDLRGSFHVSTADYLRLADGARFSARLSDTSTLSVALPVAFGFLSAQPAGIRIDQSTLEVQVGQTISVVGGDIEMVGAGRFPDGPNLSAPSGRINLASVASAGEVVPGFAAQGPTLDVSTVRRLGQIRLVQHAFVDASGNEGGGGTITLRAGGLLLDSAGLFADTQGTRNGAPTGIDIVADSVQLEASFIGSRAFQTGNAGDTTVQAREVTLSGGSQLSGTTVGGGHGGTVTVTAAETLTLRGTDPDGHPSAVFANTLGTTVGAGSAGAVDIRARDIVLSDGAQIGSGTFGSGQAGTVTVTATDTLTLRGTSTLSGGSPFSTGVFSDTEGAGNAGPVHVQAKHIMLSDGAVIAGTTFGAGSGGTVTVTATETLTIQGGVGPEGFRSGIVASTEGAGAGGTVEVQARDILLSEGGGISSSTFGAGLAGRVTVTARDTLTLQGTSPDGTASSGIFAGTRGSGAGGTVNVQAQNILISGGAQINARTAGPAPGGTVQVTATEALTIAGRGVNGPSGLFSNSVGSGRGGDIHVQARHLTLSNEGSIAANSTGAGNAGTIHLQVQDQFRSTNSTVTTEGIQTGGGDITIEAGGVYLTNSRVTAAALGEDKGSNGGNVTIRSGAIALNRSQVKASAREGHGGTISIGSPKGVILTDTETCPAGSCLAASAGPPEITAIKTDVRSAVIPLPQTFASAATMLRNRCPARLREGMVSSLVERGRDGVPAHPGGLLPSRLSAPQAAATTPRAAGQRHRKAPVAQQGGLQRDAHGQLHITHWPTAVASAQGQEGECGAR